MKPAILLEWQNLVFVLPMAFALILLGVSVFGGEHHHGSHDVSDHSLTHDVDGYGAASHESESASILNWVMDVLGIGKVPLSILVFTWCMLFGFIGLLLEHFILLMMVPGSLPNVLASGLIAFFSAGIITSLLARIIGKFLPRFESYSERKQDFINREAEVRYTITARSGTVTLVDRYGNLQQLQVYLDHSWKENIPPHTKVILLSYDAAEDAFSAIPSTQLTSA